MIDFYALTSPNVIKIFLMLEECELPYNMIPVDVWKGDQFSPEFTRINPNQKIPAIVDHEGPGGKPITIFESGAILQYLGEKTGKFIPKDARTRYEMLQWLMVQMTSVGPMFGQLVHFSRFAPKGSDYGLARYRSEVLRLYDLCDKRLSGSMFIGCGEYTIADMAFWPWLRNYQLLGLDVTTRRHVIAWVEKIAARDAVKRAVAKVGAITSTRDTASDDDKDRFFGRGKYARVA
jgi:GSH-dependent disulfide-bond oxidoreductase